MSLILTIFFLVFIGQLVTWIGKTVLLDYVRHIPPACHASELNECHLIHSWKSHTLYTLLRPNYLSNDMKSYAVIPDVRHVPSCQPFAPSGPPARSQVRNSDHEIGTPENKCSRSVREVGEAETECG